MSQGLYLVKPTEGFRPDIGRWIWALEDTRARTKRITHNLNQSQLDWKPEGVENSIGSLLYHLAATEASWLYEDVLGLEFNRWPSQAQGYFAGGFWVSDQDRRLLPVLGKPIKEHLELLDYMRGLLLEAYRPMPLEDFRRLRKTDSGDLTPEWVLHHLTRHEAEHQGQMLLLKSQVQRLMLG